MAEYLHPYELGDTQSLLGICVLTEDTADDPRSYEINIFSPLEELGGEYILQARKIIQALRSLADSLEGTLDLGDEVDDFLAGR